MHCERGTGNNTYQLMWEVGMLSGFLFENMWTESHPDTIYWICIGICVTLLLMYEFFYTSVVLQKNGGKTVGYDFKMLVYPAVGVKI